MPKSVYIPSYARLKERVLNAKHHFHMLHLHRSSSDVEIRTARKDLAKMLHPDVNSARDAHALMAKVNAACTELLNDRDAYLRTLSQRPCPGCAGRGFTTKHKGFTKSIETICSSCYGSGVL